MSKLKLYLCIIFQNISNETGIALRITLYSNYKCPALKVEFSTLVRYENVAQQNKVVYEAVSSQLVLLKLSAGLFFCPNIVPFFYLILRVYTFCMWRGGTLFRNKSSRVGRKYMELFTQAIASCPPSLFSFIK